MSFIGTFGMFTTVRLGVYTSQQGLNLTGNNIANINTVGYTRQTLDIKSMNASGVDRYTSSNVRIGSGAIATNISQLRDPYLDIRYRTECASVGYMDTKLSNLNDLAAILDEVGEGDDEHGIISAQLSKLSAALQNFTEYTGQDEFDTQVRAAADSLVSLFRSYASKMETVQTNAVERFEKDITAVNELLTNIQNLNVNIRKGDIHGAPSLEMRDERNRLIDELSQYINIDVEETVEEISAGVTINKLTIKLADKYNPPVYLVDGIYGVQLQQDKTMARINPDYDPNVAGSLPYLDAAGNEVANIADAEQVENTNFNLSLSRLEDPQGNPQKSYISVNTTEIDLNGNDANGAPVTIDGTSILDIINNQLGADGRLSWSSNEAADGTLTEYQLRTVTDANGQVTGYKLTETVVQNSTSVQLADNDLYGKLQASREFLTESGEFATEGYINLVDPKAATKRGIPYYQNALDLLAKKFAETMNTANNAFRYIYDSASDKYYYVDADGKSLGIEKKDDSELTAAVIADLEQKGASRAEGYGNLFSTRGDNDVGEGITASNISISAKWANGDVKIVNSYEVITGTNTVATTDNTNILHMVALMNKDMKYYPDEIVGEARNESMFTGSFVEMFGNINGVLGNDQSSTQIMLDNFYMSAVELDTSRDSVSSVDLNDETVNMIQYQKSYSAACRLMTTMDEILDKLINGTGVAGR